MALQLPSTVPPANPYRQNNFRSFGLSYIPTMTLPGCYVGSDDDISARDVPNDGSISFFPSKDLSHIVIKQWNGNTLESAVYVLAQNKTQNQQTAQSNPLPPPPVVQPVQTQESQTNKTGEAILAGFKQLAESLDTMQQSLDKLNSRFSDEGGMG